MKTGITEEDAFGLERAVIKSITAEKLLELTKKGPIIYGFAHNRNNE